VAVGPACAAFAYRKEPRRRDYGRLRPECGTDDAAVASQSPRGGGVLTSLMDSDGLVEPPDDTTTVAPGDMLTDHPHALPWST
jgi:molybdopterin molybdotransferase